MDIEPGKHVDSKGKVHLHYMDSWKKVRSNWDQHFQKKITCLLADEIKRELSDACYIYISYICAHYDYPRPIGRSL